MRRLYRSDLHDRPGFLHPIISIRVTDGADDVPLLLVTDYKPHTIIGVCHGPHVADL